jgi:hypothetical protein
MSVSRDEFSDNWDRAFKPKRPVFIYNPQLQHQCDHADAMRKAGCEVTTDRGARGDITIVSGPHYSSELLRSPVPGLYMIDRAYWRDPEYIALYGVSGRLRTYGAPIPGHDKYRPALEPMKIRRQTALVLLDYSESPESDTVKLARQHFDHVRVRPHPAMQPTSPVETLESAVMLSDVVIGSGSTALIKAAIWGRQIHCTVDDSPASEVSVPINELGSVHTDRREEWLDRLAWHCFSLNEIAEGVAFKSLGINSL